MHSNASGAMIKERRQSRSLMCQESGSRQIGRSCRKIIVCFMLLIALALIIPVIMSWTTNGGFVIPPQFLMAVGVPLLAVGVCLSYYFRVQRDIGEGEANQIRFQVPNASTVLTLPVEDHTEPNDHQDRPERQQLTTPSAAFDPHHTAVPNDHRDRPERQQLTTPSAAFDPHHTAVPNDHRDRPERQQLTTPSAAFDPHHTAVPNDHQDRPERQQLTTPSAAFDPHHTAVPNDHRDRPERQQLTTPSAAFDPHHTAVPNDHRDRPERQQLTTPSAAFDPHHTAVLNDHQDRPQRQQSTAPTASSDHHHYVVFADCPNSPNSANSPTQVDPDDPPPLDCLPSYETVMKYSYLYKVPQPPSS